jgi:hypothetical protein
MRYCGNCGASLGPDALGAGRCPACGASVTANGDVLATDPTDVAEQPTRLTNGVIGWWRHTRAVLTGSRTAGAGVAHTQARPLVPFVGAVVLLLLVGTLVAAVLRGQQFSGARKDAPSKSASQVSDQTPRSATTALPTSARAAPQASPSASSSLSTPVISVGASATITTTAASQPVLSVSPTAIRSPCVNASASFTVTNSGGGTLNWSATADNILYVLAPNTGSLASGQQVQVRVDSITLGGKVTITAPDAVHSPQTVTITCG